MATIGTFTKSGEDFTGTVKTLALNVKAKIARAEKENDKAPDYRIFAGATEFGGAWKTPPGAGRRSLWGKVRGPELPGADLRLAGRDRGRGRLCPRLAPPQPRLSRGDGS